MTDYTIRVETENGTYTVGSGTVNIGETDTWNVEIENPELDVSGNLL